MGSVLVGGRLIVRPSTEFLDPGKHATAKSGRTEMAQDCPFCRIAKRQVKTHAVYEDDQLLAVLDRGPIRPGHTQIIPKEHFPCFDEAPAAVVTSIVLLGRRLAVAMKELFRVPRVAFLFTDIAHVHAHVVPLHQKTDITSRRYIVEEAITFRNLPPASEGDLAEMARKLLRSLADAAPSVTPR